MSPNLCHAVYFVSRSFTPEIYSFQSFNLSKISHCFKKRFFAIFCALFFSSKIAKAKLNLFLCYCLHTKKEKIVVWGFDFCGFHCFGPGCLQNKNNNIVKMDRIFTFCRSEEKMDSEDLFKKILHSLHGQIV